MEKFLILQPYLKQIADGKLFKTVFSWILRILAGLIILITLWSSWQLWSNLPGNLPAKFFIGALISEIFLLGTGFVVFNILWIRSNDIETLPSVKDYSVTPIVVIFIKVSGEIIASIFILLGAAGGLSSLIIGRSISNFIPPSLPFLSLFDTGGSGLFVVAFGFIVGFIILAFFYFIAEESGALVDIARNTKKR